MTKVELVKAKTFELDPSKKYLITFDSRAITQQDIHILMNKLSEEGIKIIAIVLRNSDGNTMKVIEAPGPRIRTQDPAQASSDNRYHYDTDLWPEVKK